MHNTTAFDEYFLQPRKSQFCLSRLAFTHPGYTYIVWLTLWKGYALDNKKQFKTAKRATKFDIHCTLICRAFSCRHSPTEGRKLSRPRWLVTEMVYSLQKVTHYNTNRAQRIPTSFLLQLKPGARSGTLWDTDTSLVTWKTYRHFFSEIATKENTQQTLQLTFQQWGRVPSSHTGTYFPRVFSVLKTRGCQSGYGGNLPFPPLPLFHLFPFPSYPLHFPPLLSPSSLLSSLPPLRSRIP